jgi:hypothetical protein
VEVRAGDLWGVQGIDLRGLEIHTLEPCVDQPGLVEWLMLPASLEVVEDGCLKDFSSLRGVDCRGTRLRQVGQWALACTSSLRFLLVPGTVKSFEASALAYSGLKPLNLSDCGALTGVDAAYTTGLRGLRPFEGSLRIGEDSSLRRLTGGSAAFGTVRAVHLCELRYASMEQPSGLASSPDWARVASEMVEVRRRCRRRCSCAIVGL